jgi:tetratricopeptide (TPR) repeat protein
MTPLLLLLCLLCRPADALDGTEGLGELAQDLYSEAQRLETGAQYRQAAVQYRALLRLAPGFAQAVVALGRVLEAQGDDVGAIGAYQRAPFDADAVESLARLHLRLGEPQTALPLLLMLRDLAPGSASYLVLEAQATADGDPVAAQSVLLEYLGRPGIDVIADGLLPVAAQVSIGLSKEAFDGEATALLDAVHDCLEALDTPPEGPVRQLLLDLRDQLEVEAQARRMAGAANEPLSAQDRIKLGEARQLLHASATQDAVDRVAALKQSNPRNAAVWSLWSDVQLQLGALDNAEQAIRMAERLDPLDPGHPARLGDLLARHYGGRFAQEAADAYARALSRGDARAVLWFRQAEALLRAGAPDRAAEANEAYLNAQPTGAHAVVAQAQLAGFQRSRVQLPVDVPDRGPPDGVNGDIWLEYNVALRRVERGAPHDHALALALLDRVINEAPDFVRARNLQARIRYQAGEHALATALYEASLERDQEQLQVMVLLADLYTEQGVPDRAAGLIDRAAALGSPDAQLRLAQLDVDAWHLWSARERLEQYFHSPTGGASPQDALLLAQYVDERIRAVWLGAAVAGGLAILGPLGWRRTRRYGVSLEELLLTAPAAYPEVARICSAIRHEVLKHHTTVLAAVGDALESGDPDLAGWAASRLYGPQGAIARFHMYLRELETLGRVHRVPLNLQWKDPIFGPLIAAMNRLDGLERAMSAQDPSIAPVLRHVAVSLNQTGYLALGSLLQRVCLLAPDDALLHGLWGRVQSELRIRTDLDLQLPSERWFVRIFRRELDDILVNLLRNAAEAVADEGGDVGVCVQFEEDEITGLERVAIRVRDTAPRRISTAMIRGRYIERGLGLAVDLISRNGGSVHVEDEPGAWQKAVVVRLPRAEASFSDDSPTGEVA